VDSSGPSRGIERTVRRRQEDHLSSFLPMHRASVNRERRRWAGEITGRGGPPVPRSPAFPSANPSNLELESRASGSRLPRRRSKGKETSRNSVGAQIPPHAQRASDAAERGHRCSRSHMRRLLWPSRRPVSAAVAGTQLAAPRDDLEPAKKAQRLIARPAHRLYAR